MNEIVFSSVEPPYWGGSTVWLIGGGPSLSGLDPSLIRRQPGIKVGVNKSAWIFGCDCMVTLDGLFARNHRRDIEGFIKRGGTAYIAAWGYEQRIPGAIYLGRDLSPGLSCDPSVLHGANSGYAALGVAYLKRATDIRLLGYDMRYSPDGKTHFHDGYRWHSTKFGRLMRDWALEIDQVADQLIGARVVNYIGEPESLIQGYERRPLEDIGA